AGKLQTARSQSSALPQILGQPRDQIVIPGDLASFSVVVADTSGVSYQWFFNGNQINGATGDTLLLTQVDNSNEGPYWVVVSNSSGDRSSSLAFLFIDSDTDGMPDSWETAHFGNFAQAPTADYDGDGVSNG